MEEKRKRKQIERVSMRIPRLNVSHLPSGDIYVDMMVVVSLRTCVLKKKTKRNLCPPAALRYESSAKTQTYLVLNSQN